MDHNSFYRSNGAETSSSPFVDWLGALRSPTASDQALMGPEDISITVSHFEEDIDNALGTMCNTMAAWDFTCESDPAVDWPSILNAAMPYPLLTDDTSSATHSPNNPPSLCSDHTLVNSPLPSLPLLESAPVGSAPVDQPIASPSSAFNNSKFAFQCQPMATILPSPSLQQYYSYNGYDSCQGQYYWAGQQLPQHEVGAAGAVAPGLTSAVEVNASANAFAFTALDPTSLPAPPLPSQLQQEPVIVTESKPIQITQKKRSRINPKSSGGESNDAEAPAPTPHPKRKRKQDTTPRFLCPFPGCDSKHSRTHNLKVHYDSVHLRKRPHACDAPGCPRAFSRKHDLIRHHQSAHTNLGSPRKATGVKGSKGANSREVKKDGFGA